jgi:predicted PurR-regulated permease PerM
VTEPLHEPRQNTHAEHREPLLPRAILVLIGLAATVLVVAGMRSVADIIAPVFLGLTLVITVNPLQRWMIRRHVPAWLAVVACLLLLYVVLLGLVTALGVSVARLAEILPNYSDQFTALYDDISRWLTRAGVSNSQIQDALNKLDLTSIFGLVQTFLSGLIGATSNFVFLLTAMVFLAIDSAGIPQRLEIAARARPELVAAMGSFASGVRSYWLVSTLFGFIVALLDTLALYWLGIPLALLWGLLSFITNYIPNIGFVLGLVPPALLALLVGGPGKLIAVVIVYSALNVVVQTIIQPKFTGDAVGLTITVTFLSLVFWAWVLGPLGALLALPMTLFVKAVLIDADPRARWVNAIISSKPHRTGRRAP